MKKLFLIFKNSRNFKDFINKFFKFFFKALGYPNYADILLTKIRKLITPNKTFLRKKLALNSIKNYKGEYICKKKGYLLFDKKFHSGIDNIIKVCNSILDKKGEDLSDWYAKNSKSKSKSFFFNVLDKDDLLANPELLEFVLSEKILDCAINYFGFVPELCSLGLFVSPENKENNFLASQNYHLDGENQHLKCYIYLSEVTKLNGAFTFIPKDKTDQLRIINGGKSKSCGLENQNLLNAYDQEYSISLEGHAGSGGIIDTSSCLHYGSRCIEGSRIVFMFHFSAFADYTQIENNILRDIRLQHFPEIKSKFSNTKLKKIVLNC